MKHGFIGFGNLAKAIHTGLRNDESSSFSYISKSNEHKEIEAVINIKKLVVISDIIWLCVKPQNLVEVLTKLKSVDLKDKIVISPVAGKTIGFIEEYLGENTTIIRIMPNLAIAYQKSVTAFCTNSGPLSVKKVKKDLEKLGKVVELPEQHFDLFTAIFGSGPAFLLEVLSVFRNKIKELDVSDKVADELLLELLAGTTIYFQKNYIEKDINKLIQNITSKGGATEAGLQYFNNNNLDELLENIILTAKNRSKEMQ